MFDRYDGWGRDDKTFLRFRVEKIGRRLLIEIEKFGSVVIGGKSIVLGSVYGKW